MAVEVFIHKMSDHMETAKIIQWLVEEGEHVEEYQALIEVETDKAVAELESPATGVLKNIRPGVVDGAEIPVGEVIAYIADVDEEVPVLLPFDETGEDAVAESTVHSSTTTESAIKKPTVPGTVRATPIARRVAKDLKVDISEVKGSGPDGRVREQDVRDYLDNSASTPPILESGHEIEILELTSYQTLTGQRMLDSVHTAPQFSLNSSIDMSTILWLREALLDQILSETGIRLSITALLIKIIAEVLMVVPQVNASFENGYLKLYKSLNICLAMGTDTGLVVPVITDADKKSLPDIALEINQFQDKAREKRFKPKDLTGGTFTLSNLGMYGIDQFHAIINPPQSAILAVGRIMRIPVALEDDTITVRPMTNFTLTVDHRCIDGIQGAKFLDELRKRVEKPYSLLKT